MCSNLKKNYENAPAYSELDDWSIPATDGSGNSNRTLTPFMTLRDGNVLPEYQNADNTPNAQSIAAIKQELVNGHGVSIAYTADMARPGQSADTRYINRETWAQYTFEINDISHAVCIVGYDDDYPASSFTHDVLARETDANGNWVKDENDRFILAKDANGQPYVDEVATAASTSASANQALSKQSVEFLNENRVPVPLYGQAVVNKGESFLFSNGQWADWTEHIAALPIVEGVPVPGVTLPGGSYIEQFPIDNFSIRLYAVPAEITLTHQEAKAATCTEPGNIEYWYYDTSEGQRQYYKDQDGKEEIDLADTVIAPLGHKWGAWTELDGEQHQRVCERDSSHVEKAEHVWDEGEVTTEPTATNDGVRTHICKDCGATKTESIPATGSAPKDDDDNAHAHRNPLANDIQVV